MHFIYSKPGIGASWSYFLFFVVVFAQNGRVGCKDGFRRNVHVSCNIYAGYTEMVAGCGGVWV